MYKDKVLGGRFLGGGSQEERHPIMMPMEGLGHQSQSSAGRRDDARGAVNRSFTPEDDVTLSTPYDTVHVDPLPVSAIQDQNGGYLGPESTNQIAPAFPISSTNIHDHPAYSRDDHPHHRGALSGIRRGPPSSMGFESSADEHSDMPPPVGCWATLTHNERRLVVIAGALSTLVILLLATLGLALTRGVHMWGTDAQPIPVNDVCLSPECAVAAGALVASMDTNVDPCDDFARFSCGGWYKHHPIPAIEHRWGSLDVLDEQTLLDLKGLLEEDPPDDAYSRRAARYIYRACINDTEWSRVGLKPVLNLLEAEGGLPMTTLDWDEEGFDVANTISRLRKSVGGMWLVGIHVAIDERNSSRHVIHLDEGILPIRREILLPDEANSTTASNETTTITTTTTTTATTEGSPSESSSSGSESSDSSPSPSASHSSPVKKKYTSHWLKAAKDLIKAMDLDEDDTDTLHHALHEEVDTLWDFYLEIAKIFPVAEEQKDKWATYNLMKVKDLQTLTDAVNTSYKIQWQSVLQDTFAETGITITEEEEIVVEQPDYLMKLLQLLDQTSKRVIANYILYQLVEDVNDEVTDKLRLHTPGRKVLPVTWSFGRKNLRPWYDCTDKTRRALRMAVGSIYAKNRFTDSARSKAKELVEDVSAAFRSMLTSATWMDNSTREEALRKIDLMSHQVAYPDFVLDDKELEEYHQGLPQVSSNAHLENMLKLSAWHSNRSLLILRQSPQKSRWPRGPVETNAFYSPHRNTIFIPVAVLQPPLFHHQTLSALSYGALGGIVGHEITHGFDSNGRQLDSTGSLNIWWSNSTLQQYLGKTKCFVDQYSSYRPELLLSPYDRNGPLKIKGEVCLGENIADNGGIRAAFKAYRKKVEENQESLVLPGLQDYTQDQLFFMSFSKLWCSQYTPWALKHVLDVDVHSPGAFRITGVLQNTREFSEAFGCSLGTRMNPEEKCLLW